MKKIIFVCVTIVLFMSTYSAADEAQVTFVGNGQQLNNFVGRGVALGDLDRDGDLDFVLVTQQEPFARIYLNDGKGRFMAGRTLGTNSAEKVAVADFNGDGSLDIFLACSGAIIRPKRRPCPSIPQP